MPKISDIRDSETNLYNCDSKKHFNKPKTKVIPLLLGRKRKKYLATYPNLDYYRREILAHRLLYFNDVIGFKIRKKAARNSHPPVADFSNYDLDWCRSNPRQRIPRKYVKHRPSREMTEAETETLRAQLAQQLPRNDPETPEESWQRRKFVKRMRQDVTSSNVYEVVIQSRMAAQTREELLFAYQGLPTIYSETLRTAMFTHDWALACKSAEGMAEEAKCSNNLNIAWTGGFLATTGLFPDNLEKLLEFAQVAENLFPYSYRWGIEIATWFTQKGAFLDGYNFLRSELEKVPPSSDYNNPKYYRRNIKRTLLDFIVNLFEAVYHYARYKREEKQASGWADGDEGEHQQRLGENALNHFERLLAKAKESDFDVTIFIEPLIELFLKFRSKKEAKDTLKQVCLQHFGNGILEGLYLRFLRQHFPTREKEIRIKEKKFKRYQFGIKRKEILYHEQILRRYLEEKSTKNTQVPMKQIPKPGFQF